MVRRHGESEDSHGMRISEIFCSPRAEDAFINRYLRPFREFLFAVIDGLLAVPSVEVIPRFLTVDISQLVSQQFPLPENGDQDGFPLSSKRINLQTLKRLEVRATMIKISMTSRCESFQGAEESSRVWRFGGRRRKGSFYPLDYADLRRDVFHYDGRPATETITDAFLLVVIEFRILSRLRRSVIHGTIRAIQDEVFPIIFHHRDGFQLL
ncbi:MAG: hypothetical protein QXM12_02845 [Nitrososphaerota archaeon]